MRVILTIGKGYDTKQFVLDKADGLNLDALVPMLAKARLLSSGYLGEFSESVLIASSVEGISVRLVDDETVMSQSAYHAAKAAETLAKAKAETEAANAAAASEQAAA